MADEPPSALRDLSEGCSGVAEEEEGMTVLMTIKLLAFASGTARAATVGFPPRRLWVSSVAGSVGRGLDPGDGLGELAAVGLLEAEFAGIALDVEALLLLLVLLAARSWSSRESLMASISIN